MSVVRVGFVLGLDNLLGGVNYFRNLLTAIHLASAATIQPVIFTGLKSDISAYDGLAEIVRTSIFDRYTPLWWASKFLSKIFPRRDYLTYWTMRNHQIDLASHYGPLWKGCSIASMAWITDFQHLHLPGFFDERACAKRDARFKNIISNCDAVLLSSQDALDDLNRFYPGSTTPTHILRFVSILGQSSQEIPNRKELTERYRLDRPWLYIPNQFWIHKNHEVVIDALNLLKLKGNCPLVIATGSTSDIRKPDYFSQLMRRVNEFGLQNDFRILGIVPYSDVVALMRDSIAVINPSLFEGWSTSVEEAKAMGKKMILSDIAVHREQNPVRGYYCGPSDTEHFAKLISIVTQEYDQEEEELYQAKAKEEQSMRRDNFSDRYKEIVTQVVRRKALGRRVR